MIDGTVIKTKFYNGKVIGLELPTNLTIEVEEAPEAVQGNTVTNATKKIKLVTGHELDAPQFVSQGDKIIVNTETGKYVGKG
jgi:elongation factor P